MLIIALNILFGTILGLTLCFTDTAHWGWSIAWGVLGFAAGQALTGYLIQKRVKLSMERIQEILETGRRSLTVKTQRWQTRPPGSLKQAQAEMERDMRRYIESALEATTQLERFRLWVPLIDRQIATLRMQFFWMLKEFKKVDALMARALFLDPMMASIKIARMHMKGEEGIEKVFRKHTARLRYGQGAMLYGLYAWILVKERKIDEAHKLLIAACDKLENETLKRNRDALANNRLQQFSNAGFGDEWYSLHLEQPKVKYQRQRQNTFGRQF